MSQTSHLTRRKGTWYYRRRVPHALVKCIGSKFIQFSLHTTDLNEAKKRRAVEEIKTAHRFEGAAAQSPGANSGEPTTGSKAGPPSQSELIRLVCDYVERSDNRWQRMLIEDPPESGAKQQELKDEVDQGLCIVRDRYDPRADETIYETGKKILEAANRSIDDPAIPYAAFASYVRRGFIELQRRKLADLDDQPSRIFDQAFSRERWCDVTFGQLADQATQIAADDAAVNGTSAKWVDKQRANFVLLREVIGNDTLVRDIDYDVCLKVRSVLARVPGGRTKLYGGLSLDQAIAQAQTDDRPGLSPVTQDQYLATLRGALELAAKKRLITTNPAEGLKPLKRDVVRAGDKRLPFTPVQLTALFEGKFYRTCSRNSPPYAHDKNGWRFWLPLMCLYMGLRPNEVCQMRAADVKCTPQGTWYVDVAENAGDDETGADKTLKTQMSRRRVPIHPELLAVGLVDYAKLRLSTAPGSLLFGGLKPDYYGNYAKYALKRFRENYLPEAITLEPRQSFYSFRHNFRDALRRIDAPPDALQALGGWSQGKLVSDDYGDKSNPDYQLRFMSQVIFPGLELDHLHLG